MQDNNVTHSYVFSTLRERPEVAMDTLYELVQQLSAPQVSQLTQYMSTMNTSASTSTPKH